VLLLLLLVVVLLLLLRVASRALQQLSPAKSP
jgi:hypothetical protein